MTKKDIYTVSEITFAVKRNLETGFQRVQVKGEITNLRRQSSGHIYFSLKDQNCQISAVLFQNQAKTLSRPLKDGDGVILEGDLSVYAPKGTYQIIARSVTFDGMGELLLELYRLKEELAAKGFFDPARKKQLPFFPKTIGVITSPSGAVIQDIIHVLTRRFSGFHLILNPVKVQGEGASQEIATAVDDFNKHNLADVLIVCRGGGSLEDLWPFNEKVVAEAIYRSKIPVISAVGHETDFSISDFVADVRAPTPSAAAELVLQEKKTLKNNLNSIHKHLLTNVSSLILQHKYRVERYLSHPKMTDAYTLLAPFEQKLDDIVTAIDEQLKNRLEKRRLALQSKQALLHSLVPNRQVEKEKKQLEMMQKALSSKILHSMNDARERLKSIITHLAAINPKNVLKKGYCICFLENTNSVIISAKAAPHGADVSLLMHDGKIKAKVQ